MTRHGPPSPAMLNRRAKARRVDELRAVLEYGTRITYRDIPPTISWAGTRGSRA